MNQFPSQTCETVVNGGQVYSSSIDFLGCILLFSLLLKSNKKLFVFSLFLFQLYHGLSHMIHFNDTIQTNMIHYLAYFVNLSLFLTVGSNYKGLILLLMILDVYLGTPRNIGTQALIFLLLLPFDIVTVIMMGVVIMLLINEHYNCEKIKKWNPHILVEIVGSMLFYKVALDINDL